MLRPLAFIPVWQQQHERGILTPLRAISGNELIDYWLRDIDEVSVLRFPEHQGVLGRRAVSVLEAEHGGFRERAVIYLEPAMAVVIRNEIGRASCRERG